MITHTPTLLLRRDELKGPPRAPDSARRLSTMPHEATSPIGGTPILGDPSKGHLPGAAVQVRDQPTLLRLEESAQLRT